MTHINAYVNFSGNCREAMTFYNNCIGGELNMQTIEGSPIEHECPGSMKHQILHASLTKDSLVLMGSDMSGPDGWVQGNNIALSLNCSSEEEIAKFFSTLSAGGTIMHPLSASFWGATFGVFTDKYGIRWMLNYDKNIQ
ncbi:MAG: VOC family protein [Bacteroidota bacterium]|nr:VOC family protein [Bacteroidota bacterium]MDP4231482.1 VOC family protein [Bacteroidota bacterium]MDP4237460.1 VOC family protein [Bacteroidota bacterium]